MEYLIHQSDEAIIVFDEQGALTLWNAAMERIFGLNRENLVGKSIFDINGVFHREQDQPLIDSALDGKVRFSSNRQSAHPITGQTIFYQAKFVPMADGDGGAVFIIDQTEQIRFREGLLKSEQYQRIINYFTSSLLDKTSVDEILWDVSKNCISGLDFVDCVIYLFDEDGRKLVQRAATRNNRPENPTFLNSMAIPLGDGIVGSVALSGKGEIVNNVNQDPR
ncbi:MAG: PAS domain S-box protein, partial [Bacteroidota bacterium]